MTLSVFSVCPTARKGGAVTKLYWVGLLAVAVMTFGAILSVAQGVSGRIVGTLTDSSGAVIPNAAVAITNQDTGVIIRVVSNSNGGYRVDNLPPGNYQILAEAANLESILSKGNVVTVDNSTVVNLTMKVGAANETVTVSAANVLVDTTSSSLAEVVSEREISNLPLNGRICSQLIQTVPGRIAAGFA